MQNQYLPIEEIKELHFELTEECNASCPMCARNVHGSIENPFLGGHQLDLDFFQRRINWEELSALHHIMLCGVFGDPVAAQDCLPIIRFFKEKQIPSVYLYTNGGLRNERWWESLGEILSDPEDLVVFGIDGLGDTNHLYRREVKWERLMANVKAFISSGGNARWDFLVFQHNQHQVESAKEFASELGVKKFRLRKTSRFSNPSVRKGSAPFKVLKKQTSKDNFSRLAKKKFKDEEIEYSLHQPTIQKYTNDATNSGLSKLFKKYGSFENYMNNIEISCIYREKFKRVYISADGKLWPCCYIGGDRKTWDSSHIYRENIKKNIIERYGENFNSLKRKSLSEVFNHAWFKDRLVRSFGESTKSSSNPRLLKCARTCGKMFNPILSQSEDQKVKISKLNRGSDIFFLSYDEKKADRNWCEVKSRFSRAKRVHGVKGIFNAHRECALQSETPYFFVVDGDSELLPKFSFDSSNLNLEDGAVYVWRALNPVNGLIYGYGGVKLFSKSLFRDAVPLEERMSTMADMSTTIANGKYIVIHKLASVTHFNTSPFNAWRGAFRECAKLAAQTIKNQNQNDTNQRLYVWKHRWAYGAEFGDWCVKGAKAGAAFGFQYVNEKEKLSQINDFSWLNERFEKSIFLSS